MVETLRAIAQVHAVAAWLAVAALLAAVWAHRGGRRPRAATALGLVALGLSLAAGGTGMALHDGYRARIRQKLFLASPSLGWLFERKQHLAFGAVMLAIAGAAITLLLPRADEATARELRRGAALAWTASAALALAAAIASVVVGGRMRF